ncbi:hypothetical protein SDC49_07285 [Lactobacillus sp. R2/2]|nr:hypothetical protein [Lactobacillus sp. R2/2]
MYELVSAGLKISFTVENPNQTIMPFALGFHPGWNIKGFLEEYSIELEGSATLLQDTVWVQYLFAMA